MGKPTNPKYGPFYGGVWPQGGAVQEIPDGLRSSMPSANAQGNTYRFGGLVTYEKPITEFFGDVAVSSSTYLRMTSGSELPRNCVGVRFVNLVAGVVCSINGGGFRTVLNNDVLDGCEIHSLEIQTNATGLVTVQSVGTGD